MSVVPMLAGVGFLIVCCSSSSAMMTMSGGESVGQSTLTRFYSAHTFVLPLAAAVLMLTHFLMIRKQGISGPL